MTPVLLASIFAVTITDTRYHRSQASKLTGRTPCCLDRLTTITCIKIQSYSPVRFANRCLTDADFAMVQCCNTCFDRKLPNSTSRYNYMIHEQLLSPFSSLCWDRRGTDWCTKLVEKQGFWKLPKYSNTGCSSFTFAFRECRQSCGYCSAGQYLSKVVYDHKTATDSQLCDAKVHFARSNEIKRTQSAEFDPLASLNINKNRNWPEDNYFVVTNYNYNDYDFS